jgi:hypothetical protein
MKRAAVLTMLGCLASCGVVACGGGDDNGAGGGSGKTTSAGFKVPDVPT